jgi:methionyl aminopeptidase
MKRNRKGIQLKSAREIEIMREANVHVAEILDLMCEAAVPGASTWDLDQIARREIEQRKVESAFLGYHGFPATVCASVNEQIVHGIPSKKTVFKEGDILGLDFGVVHRGYVGDSARTVGIGEVSNEAQRLMDVTRASLEAAIAVCRANNRLSDIGTAVQTCAEAAGFSVVRDFVGHGIGQEMHEEPQVPNYYEGPRPRMKPGLVIAIEPMINEGTHEVKVLEDGWTAVTRDGKLSAHFEHSVAITEGDPIVLSRI